jgi:hypothetical protein
MLNALMLRQDNSDVNLDGVRVAIGRPVYING